MKRSAERCEANAENDNVKSADVSTWTPCRVDEFSRICIADHVPFSPGPVPCSAKIKAKKYGNVNSYSNWFPIARVHRRVDASTFSFDNKVPI